MIQQLRSDEEDHIVLFMACDIELFNRARLQGFNTDEFVERMTREYGPECTVLNMWLKLRELVRDVGLSGMSRPSRAILVKAIVDRYIDFEDEASSEEETERFRESRAELS